MGNGEILERLAQAIELGEGQSSSDFDLNKAPISDRNRVLREAGVLIGLVDRGDGLQVVLTKRASVLRHHPGQVAFPGGKLDEGDYSVHAAALREAHEEIGLKPASVRVLGALGAHETVTNFNVTPVVGIIEGAYSPIPEAGEVDTIFEVPFSFLMDPLNARIESRMWKGTSRNYYVIPYGPFYIWGATARMIVGLRHLWEQTK